MLGQLIADIIRTRETARIDQVMGATSPAAVLAKLERAEADYIAYVSGCQRAPTPLHMALVEAIANSTTWRK